MKWSRQKIMQRKSDDCCSEAFTSWPLQCSCALAAFREYEPLNGLLLMLPLRLHDSVSYCEIGPQLLCPHSYQLAVMAH